MTQPRDKSGIKQPRRISLLWRVSIALSVSLLIVIVGTGFVLLSFNPNRYAPALVSALESVTGRQVTLAGPVKIDWSLTPALQASNIVISNPPGFPDHNLLTLRSLRAEIALLPLFSNRIDILKLVLISPKLVLERLPNGKADWDLSSKDPRLVAPTIPFLNSNIKVALEAVEVQDGQLTLKAVSGEAVGSIHFTRLTGTATSLSAPLHLDAQAEIGTTPFRINGVVGPIERFSGAGSGPWPINLNMTLADAKLGIDGTVKRPRNASGYDLTVKMTIPALDRLGQALPPAMTGLNSLPPIRDITANGNISDANTSLPDITHLLITAGKSDLSALRPGLVLNALSVTIPALNQPFSVALNGMSDSGNFSLQGQFGALQGLLSTGKPAPGSPPPRMFPISINAKIGAANATITGAIATPRTLSGAALAITAAIPDLSALSAIAGTPLPAWQHISLQSSLIDPGGVGLYNTVGVDGLTVTMDNAAFGGAATLYLRPQPKLQLSLNIDQANLDALLAAYPAQAATVQTPPTTVLTTASPAPTTSPTIPDTPLPLGFLGWGNADMQISADDVVWHNATYTALQANISLAKHRLTLDPFTGEIPGGDITASGSLDDTGPTAEENVTIKAPALALGPLFKALGLPGTAEGNLQLQLTAASSGNTVRAIAANLNGKLGLAAVNAEIDPALLHRAFGTIENATGRPSAPEASTDMPASVRCLGLAAGATQGIIKLNAFGLDSSQLLLQGSGSLDLGNEVYSLTFQPFNAAAVQVGGNFAQPTITAAEPLTPPVQPSPAEVPPRPDICPTILALARLGQTGPAAPAQAQPLSTPAAQGANAPKNLLNTLLPP